MLRIHKKCNFFANENIHFFFFFKTEFPYLGAWREELKKRETENLRVGVGDETESGVLFRVFFRLISTMMISTMFYHIPIDSS